MWQQNYEPVAGNLALSALVAAIPVLVLHERHPSARSSRAAGS